MDRPPERPDRRPPAPAPGRWTSPSRPGGGVLAVALCVACLATAAAPAAGQAPTDAGVDAPVDTAGAALVGPGAGPAGPPAGSPDRIEGFWGVAWGADSAAVAERLGAPITVGRAEEGLRYFVYTPLYLGRDGFLQMWLHEEDGLVGASWEPMISDCGDMLRRLVRATRRAHPGVASRTEGRMTSDMLGGDLCMAALEKGAAVTVVWRDAEGTEIRIGTTPGSHKLRMRAITGALEARRPEGI